jgi:quercetin dioxygenase-like cupin family protein
MKQSKQFLPESALPLTDLGDGLRRQIYGYDDKIMMVKVNFSKGAIGILHHHPHAQSSYVVNGIFEVTIGEEKMILKQDDGFFAPPNTIHGVVCIEAGVILDVFSPVREDFLK